jgi:type III secretion protein U
MEHQPFRLADRVDAGGAVSEKKLPPSKQRIDDAREKGQVTVSKDVIGVLKLAVIGEFAFATEPFWTRHISEMLAAGVLVISQPRQARLEALSNLVFQAAFIAVGLACAAALVACVLTLVQTRFNVAAKAFENGPEKLNPANNLKQIVSGEKLMMLVMGPVKVGIVLAVCYSFVEGRIPVLLQMYRMTLAQGWAVSVDMLRSFLHAALFALAVLAALDFALQRFMSMRKLRMDMEEVKREHKENEGDPHQKGHRRQVANEIRNESRPKQLERPNAVVVNPEHIAIALAQDVSLQGLPRIVAKTAGNEALRLRRYAAREGVPVIRYVSLARLLYATGREGAFVPSQSVRAVALVYGAVAELADQYIEPGDEFEIDPEMASAMLPTAPRPDLSI